MEPVTVVRPAADLGVRRHPGTIRPTAARFTQPKLAVSQPGDPLEQEADLTADRVLRRDQTLPPPPVVVRSAPVSLNRMCAECHEEEDKTRSDRGAEIQRKESGPQPARSALSPASPGQGRPLEPSTRAFMEPRFGFDFSQVRIHTDASAAVTARSVNAYAFTLGRDIVFGAGQYLPDTTQGQRLLAHELTHVAQQGHADRLAKSNTPDAAYPATGVSSVRSGSLVQRQERTEAHEGEGAGCGFCIDPAPAGIIAHEMTQSKMGALGVDSEVKVTAGRRGNGRLDLARWDENSIEIGEIKPGNQEGFERGEADLKHYQRVLEETKDPKFKGKRVRRLTATAPAPQVFPNEGVSLPTPQLLKTTVKDGVYGYFCDESSRTYFLGSTLVKAGGKHVTRAVLKAKKEFFDSDCIKKKSKRRPVEETRVKIRDRAGATRVAKPAMALSLLRSRAFHLHHEVEQLHGEHSLAHAHYVKTIVRGAVFGGPIAVGAAAAAIVTGMPDLSIWGAARTAAGKTAGAGDVAALSKALAELESAIVAPRQQFLTWKARRDGTPVPTEPNTPAPAAGAQAQHGAPPPLPPRPVATTPEATAPPPVQADAGLSLTTIAALAAVVVITCLILQPELGAVAVAGATTAGAEGAAAAGAAELLAADVVGGAAATTLEAGLEALAYVVEIDPIVGLAAL